MEEEIWKDIPGYEGLYKMSSRGRCINVKTGHYMKYTKYSDGSIQIYYSLNYKQKRKLLSVYKTMYQLFRGDVPSGMCVRPTSDILDASNLKLYDSESFLNPSMPPTRKYKLGDIVNEHYVIIRLKKNKGYVAKCLQCGDCVNIQNVDQFKKRYCSCYYKIKQCDLRNHKDGRTKSKYYEKYKSMIRRCHDDSHRSYSSYGGKGIFVCKLWRDDFWEFEKFLVMSEKSSTCTDNSLDRVDPRFEYAPYNCQVIPLADNSNKRVSDSNRTKVQLYLDKLKFERRKRNWIKQMVKQGYKEEDLI